MLGFSRGWNDCYFNSLLQCLFHSTHFKLAIMSFNGILPNQTDNIIFSLHELLIDYIDGEKDNIPLLKNKLLYILHNHYRNNTSGLFSKGVQNDVSEAYINLINVLIEAEKNEKISEIAYTVNSLFIELTQCTKCGNFSIETGGNGVHEYPCILGSSNEYVTIEKIITNQEHYIMDYDTNKLLEKSCLKCSNTAGVQQVLPAQVQRMLILLPRLLVIVAALTATEKIGKEIKSIKLDSHVKAPLVMNIKKETKYANHRIDYIDYDYQLIGVAHHRGDALNSGHYVAICWDENSWYLYNDDTVTQYNSDPTYLEGYNAYMFFYDLIGIH
jgi:ubiquitin C-terminal hydrolase